MKRKGLQIDSDSEDQEPQNNGHSDEEQENHNNKKHGESYNGHEKESSVNHKRKQEHDAQNRENSEERRQKHKKQEKMREKEREKQKQNTNMIDRADRLEQLSNLKNKKQSLDEISELFVPDQSDDFSEINQIKLQLEEDARQQKLREERRRERKEKEEQERKRKEERRKEREQEEKSKRERRKEKDQSAKQTNSKSSAIATIKSAPQPKTKHEELTYEVLRRWWYCMPDWPPENFDYDTELKQRKLRVYDIKVFKRAPEADENNMQKVMPYEGYEGCYKNTQGQFIDLRPEEGKPCFSYLSKKSDSELKQMLKVALTEQITQLEQYLKDSENDDQTELNNLKKLLKRLQ